ncbi:DinB family protein [Nonlabens xiamenensis]|uniref:DinB family protein n=1 Tax=Nonlabens xiamenensis TaxID=2341043 RepID=UPI000F605EF9|nr:DinB family protein [Nonlabens xiamenensis]
MTKADIDSSEYAPYFEKYLSMSPDHLSIDQVLNDSLERSLLFLDKLQLPLDHSYAPDKWTVGQVIMHNIDTERIFAYRALRFMRGDQTSLSGFDQDIFSEALVGHAFAKADLTESLKVTRAATRSLFQGVPEEWLSRMGSASGHSMSARVIPFIIAGHYKHHENVIATRY